MENNAVTKHIQNCLRTDASHVHFAETSQDLTLFVQPRQNHLKMILYAAVSYWNDWLFVNFD